MQGSACSASCAPACAATRSRRSGWRPGSWTCDTLLLLFGLFILIEGIRKAGVIDAAAQLFYTLSGDDPFRLYTLLVFVSVGLSAFIDNIPYVATMLPVVQGIAELMNGGVGFPPELFYFGLLTGATRGRQPRPPLALRPTLQPSASCASRVSKYAPVIFCASASRLHWQPS